MIKKAVIPAAGWGTRFLPATKAMPKEMLPLVDKPAIQYTVEEAVAAGIEDILIVTGRHKRAIEDHFDCYPELEALLREKGKQELLQLSKELSHLADIHYVRQKEPRGLGDAVFCARKFIGDEPFAVLLADDLIMGEKPCIQQLIEVYNETDGTVLAIQEVEPLQVKNYGIVNPEKPEAWVTPIHDLIEKPAPADAPSRLAVVGRYVLTPEIFRLIEETTPGAGGEIQLTDALRRLRKERSIYATRFQGTRYDVGDKLGFLQATVSLALEREDLGSEFRAYLKELV